jgi:hypothetical protein
LLLRAVRVRHNIPTAHWPHQLREDRWLCTPAKHAAHATLMEIETHT